MISRLEYLRDRHILVRRLDYVLALVAIVSTLLLTVVIKNRSYRLAAGALMVGSGLYIISSLFASDSDYRTIQIRQVHHIVLVCLFAVGGVTSPPSIWHAPIIYYLSIASIASFLSILVLFSDGSSNVLIVEIVLLAVLVRSSMFYQFTSIPGVDAVHTHVPTVLQTVEAGTLRSPKYYDKFPMSHLRTAVGILLGDIEIKTALYGFIFLPEALSLIFIYTFIYRIWGRDRALIATLLLATASGHIMYGFRKIPQTTSVTLLPILLFSLTSRGRRWSVLLLVAYLAILLSHSAPPWVILSFLAVVFVLEQIVERYAPESGDKFIFSSLSLGLIFLLTIQKLEYIFVSNFHNNVGRLLNTILALFAQRDSAATSLANRSADAYQYPLLRKSLSYLLVAGILCFLFYKYIYVSVSELRIRNESLWFVATGTSWSVAGVIFVSAYQTSKIFAPLYLLFAPLLYPFLIEFKLEGRKIMSIVIIFLLVFSISLVGVVDPLSNVSYNRPTSLGMTTTDSSSLEFTSKVPDEKVISVPDAMAGYWWKTSADLQASDEDCSKYYSIRGRNAHCSEHHQIYENGDRVVVANRTRS